MAISKEYIAKSRQKAAGWYAQAGIEQSKIEVLSAYSLPQKQDEPWRYFQPHSFIEHALLDPIKPKKISMEKSDDLSFFDQELRVESKTVEQVAASRLKPMQEDYWQSLMTLGSSRQTVRISTNSPGLNFKMVRQSSVAQSLTVIVSEGLYSTVFLKLDSLRSGFSSINIVVEENAQLRLLVDSNSYAGVHDFLRIQGDVGRDASLDIHVGSDPETQPSLGRVEWLVHLNGEGAAANLSALERLQGDCGKSHYLQLHHRAPSTSSQQNFRIVASDAARASFHGGVKIDQGAKQASAHQLNKNLLLSDNAEVFTRPELQIEEDEVTCSHGATVADLDPAKEFYLQSRGLSPESAHEFLVRAFGDAVVPGWAKRFYGQQQ